MMEFPNVFDPAENVADGPLLTIERTCEEPDVGAEQMLVKLESDVDLDVEYEHERYQQLLDILQKLMPEDDVSEDWVLSFVELEGVQMLYHKLMDLSKRYDMGDMLIFASLVPLCAVLRQLDGYQCYLQFFFDHAQDPEVIGLLAKILSSNSNMCRREVVHLLTNMMIEESTSVDFVKKVFGFVSENKGHSFVFEPLMEDFRSNMAEADFLAELLAFINAFILCENSYEGRMKQRDAFVKAGLLELLGCKEFHDLIHQPPVSDSEESTSAIEALKIQLDFFEQQMADDETLAMEPLQSILMQLLTSDISMETKTILNLFQQLSEVYGEDNADFLKKFFQQMVNLSQHFANCSEPDSFMKKLQRIQHHNKNGSGQSWSDDDSSDSKISKLIDLVSQGMNEAPNHDSNSNDPNIPDNYESKDIMGDYQRKELTFKKDSFMAEAMGLKSEMPRSDDATSLEENVSPFSSALNSPKLGVTHRRGSNSSRSAQNRRTAVHEITDDDENILDEDQESMVSVYSESPASPISDRIAAPRKGPESECSEVEIRGMSSKSIEEEEDDFEARKEFVQMHYNRLVPESKSDDIESQSEDVLSRQAKSSTVSEDSMKKTEPQKTRKPSHMDRFKRMFISDRGVQTDSKVKRSPIFPRRSGKKSVDSQSAPLSKERDEGEEVVPCVEEAVTEFTPSEAEQKCEVTTQADTRGNFQWGYPQPSPKDILRKRFAIHRMLQEVITRNDESPMPSAQPTPKTSWRMSTPATPVRERRLSRQSMDRHSFATDYDISSKREEFGSVFRKSFRKSMIGSSDGHQERSSNGHLNQTNGHGSPYTGAPYSNGAVSSVVDKVTEVEEESTGESEDKVHTIVKHRSASTSYDNRRSIRYSNGVYLKNLNFFLPPSFAPFDYSSGTHRPYNSASLPRSLRGHPQGGKSLDHHRESFQTYESVESSLNVHHLPETILTVGPKGVVSARYVQSCVITGPVKSYPLWMRRQKQELQREFLRSKSYNDDIYPPSAVSSVSQIAPADSPGKKDKRRKTSPMLATLKQNLKTPNTFRIKKKSAGGNKDDSKGDANNQGDQSRSPGTSDIARHRLSHPPLMPSFATPQMNHKLSNGQEPQTLHRDALSDFEDNKSPSEVGKEPKRRSSLSKVKKLFAKPATPVPNGMSATLPRQKKSKGQKNQEKDVSTMSRPFCDDILDDLTVVKTDDENRWVIDKSKGGHTESSIIGNGTLSNGDLETHSDLILEQNNNRLFHPETTISYSRYRRHDFDTAPETDL